MMDRVPKKELV